MNTQSKRALVLRSSVAEFEKRVKALWEYEEAHPEATLGELEREAHRLSRDCFAPVLEALVEGRNEEWSGAAPCRCGGLAGYKGEQERSQETFVGRITWRRGYSYCASCRQGHYPLDEALGIGPGQFSEGLQEQVCRLGVALPFAPAAETFTALSGVFISPREVERLTEGRGMALERQQQEWREGLLQGEDREAEGEAPEGAGTWAVALDAAKVRFGDGWHEVKAGVVCWARPREEEKGGAEATQQSYVAEAGPMERAGARLYGEVVRRGVKPGEEWVVCLGDGAPANWSQFALHFPHRVEVLDWYHAVEHLWAAGNGVFGQGTPQAQEWVAARKEELWKGEVEAVLAALLHQRDEHGAEAAGGEVHYFASNQERMRYAQFRAQGYPIGSGTVESACKRLVGARVKQAGMCWTKSGAQTVLSLRAALLSGRWDQAWQATRPLSKAA